MLMRDSDNTHSLCPAQGEPQRTREGSVHLPDCAVLHVGTERPWREVGLAQQGIRHSPEGQSGGPPMRPQGMALHTQAGLGSSF